MTTGCARAGQAYTYVLQSLPAGDLPAVEAHIAACPDCRDEVETLRKTLVAWPTDVLRPTTSLQARLASRIAEETGTPPVWPAACPTSDPEWRQVAPGIECQLLAADEDRHRVSMLVRLAPGASYPAHTHADGEELHLLHGELWIDAHKLAAGDFYHAARATSDRRVWSETGCTCVLMTSTRDVLR